MPPQQSHTPIIREWLQSLGVLTAVSLSRTEAETKLAAYIPMLLLDYPDAAFTPASLNAVARQCLRGFPTYPELATALSDWWRNNRPRIPELPPPPEPTREPLTPEQLEHVTQLTRETVAHLRAARPTQLRPTQALRAIHLSPAQLDAINPLPNGFKRSAQHDA